MSAAKAEFLILLTLLAVCVYSKCNPYTVEVQSATEFQKALNEARPGAEILLLPGKYMVPKVYIPDQAFLRYYFLAQNLKGEADCPITIAGKVPNTVSLVCPETPSTCVAFEINRSSYLTVKNLELCQESADPSHSGIYIHDSSSNILVESVSFHDLTSGVGIGSKFDEIFAAKNVKVRACNFSNIYFAIEIINSDDTIIEKCRFDKLGGGAGISVGRSNGGKVIGNIFGDKESYYYMDLYGRNFLIADNTFINKKPVLYHGISSEGGHNVFMRNTFDIASWSSNGYCIYEDEEGSDDDRICASNKVLNSLPLTNAKIDQSC